MKPKLGMRVRPLHPKRASSKWDGVIVQIIPPTSEGHGVVAVWLENQTGYGGDNCEHYAYVSDEQLSRELKELKPK